jgi:hypothetical protein
MTTEESPKNKKPKKPGRWRRRLIWTLSILIVFGFVLRAVLPLALPTVMRKVAGRFGMTCTYDRLELNLFSGDAGIWGLQFKPAEGGAAIFSADYCHGNVSVWNLFKGKLNVWRVEADGVEANVDRNADGHIPLLDRFIAGTSAPATAPVARAPNTPVKMDLTAPIRIDALRLNHIHVHIHDRGVSPEVDTELAMDLRLSDLGSKTQPVRFEMNLSADPMLDTMKITGEGTSGGKNLDAKMQILVRGIRLKPAAEYLAPLGIRPVSDSITLRAEGHVHTAPAPNGAEGFTGSIAFDRLSATADRQEAMALDHLKIDTGVIDTKSIHINSIILSGARAMAGRAADGNLQAAGIEYDPALASHKPPKPEVDTPPSAFIQDLLKEHITVGDVALQNVRLDLHDDGITPAVDLSFIVDNLSAKSIDRDPANLNSKVILSGALRSPGLISDINLDGSAIPFADQKTFGIKLAASGIRPDAIRPYLDQVGLRSTLKDARFDAAIDGSLSIGDTIKAGLNITQFEFKDDKPLLALTEAKVANVTLDPKSGQLVVGDIELAGPGISVLRDSTGQLGALGMRTKPPVANSNISKPTIQAVAIGNPTTVAGLPRITIGHFNWKDIHLDLEDQTVTPPVKIAVSDISIEAKNISTDLSAKKTGHFKASLAAVGVAKTLEAEGTLAPRVDGLELDANVNGAGLDTTSFATYLKPLGIQPVLQDGALTLHAHAGITQSHDGLSASLKLDRLKFTAGSDELAGIDALLVDGLSLRNGVIGINSIEIAHPRAAARRDADGTMVAGGIRLLPTPPVDPNAAGPLVVAKASASSPATSQPALPFIIMLKKLSITDAVINWNDLAIQPAVATSVGANVELNDIALGKDAGPATLNLSAYATGSADKLLVSGKVLTTPSRQSATLNITASGLRVGALAPYLPPGIGSSLKDGQFHTTIDAAIDQNPLGGIGATLQVGPVDFRDGSNPLFELESVQVAIPRIDLPLNALTINELSVTGVQTHAEKTTTGELACMGLLLDEKGAAPTKPVEMPASAPTVVATNLPPTTGPSVQELLAASHRILPVITVAKLDLNVSKVTLIDLSRPQSAPLIISDLRLHNVDPITWLGKDAWNNPPADLNFTCKLSPLVDQVTLDAKISPFARHPNLHVDFAANGLHGNGLTQLVPELKDQIDGSTMDNGGASGHLDAHIVLDRRTPIDFDISHGFDLTFDLSKAYFRSRPDGPVLAGVDEVRSEDIRIAPADSIVHFKTLEITKPIGLVTQDKAGVHVFGWIYKLPGDQLTATTKPTVVAKNEPQPVPVAKTEMPKGEVRIDKLLIDGLDFRVIDTAVDPPLTIPLNGLDVEVRNLSSLAPYEDKPIRFSAILNAGKVKLQKKGGRPKDLEDRDLFSQITANGELSLYPKLHGWAKTSVSDLDLAELEGPAKQFNENLSAGTYDSTVDLRFDETGAIAITSKFTVTDLSLSEPPNGLIYRTLKLPAPLDVAIGAMEGADGSIALPLNVSVDPKHISYADLGLAAAGGVSQVIATAVAAAPLKAANDVGAVFGLGANKPTEELPTKVAFAPGSAALGPSQYAELTPLLRKMRKDPSLTLTIRHQLGNGDVARAEILANPDGPTRQALESQLRDREKSLLRQRSDTAGTARALLVSQGPSAAASSLQQLKAIDRELAATEESLDQMGDLIRDEHDRLKERRTRTAALQIAHDRLVAIHTLLISSGISPDRLKIVAAQFNPEPDLDGGQVVLTVVKKK